MSAAYFYQQKHGRDKKVLILDNHDDFDGHARRNEHTINDQRRIGYGRSQTLVKPQAAHKIVQDLLKDIGIDIERCKTAYDRDFFKRHDLGANTYFNKQVFGRDKVVAHPYCNYSNYIEGLQGPKLSNEEAPKGAALSCVQGGVCVGCYGSNVTVCVLKYTPAISSLVSTLPTGIGHGAE